MTPPQKLNTPAPPTAAPGQQQVKRSGALARPQTAEERRRAQRVLLKMAVVIHIQGKANPIHGFTHTVSASGAMIILPEGLSLDQYEQEIIREALRRADGNKSQAARLLGLTRNALRYRLTQMGLES